MNDFPYEILPCSDEEADKFNEKADAFDNSRMPPKPDVPAKDFVFKTTDADGAIIGGCLLKIDEWNVADLDILWVDECFRRQGLGSMLIRKAEQVSRENGCGLITLGTFDFQARPLYEKHGYRVYGVLDNYPQGHCNYSLMKRLDEPRPAYVPSNNAAAGKFTVEEGSKEDGELIVKNLGDYNDSRVTDRREEVSLSKKVLDENGNLIAGCWALLDEWNYGTINLWVDEPYRGKGIGTRLLAEVEREAEEKGAYMMFIALYEWQIDFFRKRGYSLYEKEKILPEEPDIYNMRKPFHS
ncbi:MAG: GNAT family N-acetyltransferase [Clostridia bacterium]|nr:GNAT family N-acetyltransferase [Clostridia bacterium]